MPDKKSDEEEKKPLVSSGGELVEDKQPDPQPAVPKEEPLVINDLRNP